MPYTPPATRSPASSTTASPGASRRSSLQSSSRPSLPKSASYLTRQPRRNNSWSDRAAEKTASSNTILNGGTKSSPQGLISQTTPPGTVEDLQSLVNNSVVRQSPPPITGGHSMPKGAIISPPDSSNNSSDEAEEASRGRQLEKQIQELQEAISQIPQRRSVSPPAKDAEVPVIIPSASSQPVANGMRLSFSTNSLGGLTNTAPRRISHVKSNTEPKIIVPISSTSTTGSEDDSDIDMQKKPIMVRKKSGELVRPALRASSRKRPSSMPGTPTFAKNVHFDSCLEQVRHFCDIDRPSAVSAGSSPIDTYDTDDEFPFEARKRSPPFEWELSLNNFPTQVERRKALPVYVERVWLSPDQKSLIGSVIVANLAFHKFVTCRFTLDYWKIVSEVAAEFSQEVHPRQGPIGQDRFIFNIKLSDTANLETKTLYFCVRYNVNGVEYWDNNNHANFQVDFRKKMLPQNGKRGFQGASSRPAGSLPRSNRRAVPSSGRKGSTTTGTVDDFRREDTPDRKSIQDVLGESGSISGVRLKGVKSASSIASDNLPNDLGSPSGQAFSNRYDFGASLSAAKQAAKSSSTKSDRDVDGLYMKPNRRGEAAANAAKPRTNGVSSDPARLSLGNSRANNSAMPYPAASAIASSSYEEILNKYCFFGSKQGSPQIDDGQEKLWGPRNADKAEHKMSRDDASSVRSSSSADSSSSSSPALEHSHGQTAQHHSYFSSSSGQYFFGPPLALGSSPLHSPTMPQGGRSSPSLANGLPSFTATPILG